MCFYTDNRFLMSGYLLGQNEHNNYNNNNCNSNSCHNRLYSAHNILFFTCCLVSVMTLSSAYSHHRSGSSLSSVLPYHLIADKHNIEPYFESDSHASNITISEGSVAAYLPCKVVQLADRTVSWIRRKDLHVLTVGKFTYTSDRRFQAIHLENSDDWTLQIRYPLRKDAGIYECQVSTLPKISIFVNLNVIVAKAKIIGSPILYINSGNSLNLTCVVNETPGPPDYIFWYHNGDVINYDSSRGIRVQTEKSAQTTSKLIINKALPNDSGNYSCSPSNAEAAHIAVHVHSNSNPAASIQHGKRSARDFITNASLCQKTYNKMNQLLINTGLPVIFIYYHTISCMH